MAGHTVTCCSTAPLAKSYNLASARLGLDLGLDTIVDTLARLGVQNVPRVPALMLGAGEYSPMDMAAMYQSIAAGGFQYAAAQYPRYCRCPWRAAKELSARIRPYFQPTGSPPITLRFARRACVRGQGKAFIVTYRKILMWPERRVRRTDGRDSWFAGFSGDLLAVSWVGRDDNWWYRADRRKWCT